MEPAASDAAKPTSAIVNVVWAMQYPIAPPDTSMSTGAKIGVGVAVPVGVIGIGLVSFFFWRARRRNRASVQGQPPAANPNFAQPPPPQPMVHYPAPVQGHNSISGTSGGFSYPSNVSSNQPMAYAGAGGAAVAGPTGWHPNSHPNSFYGSSSTSPVHEVAGNGRPSPVPVELQGGQGPFVAQYPQYQQQPQGHDQPGRQNFHPY
jgi:hypothetical protein